MPRHIPHPHIPHPKITDPFHIRGVRTVAAFEFTKGVIVVLAGLGVFHMRHRDIWGVAESLLEFFHVNPHQHFVGIFIDLVYQVSDIHLWKVVLVAAIYALLRFIESYGLWYLRPWAEWMAIAGGAIYIPFEISDMLRRPDWLHLAVLTINVLIVLYMLMIRVEAAKKHHAQHRHHEPPV